MTGDVHPTETGRRHFRGDIEGLRAVAVLMVLAYHVGFGGLSGGFAGVDVFFVISGFLITAHLVRELDRANGVSLASFYARRVRRLLPAATLVLAFTAVAGIFVLPGAQLRNLAVDVAASAVYLVNWTFATRSVDYLAEESGESPLLHYWTLGVEEQFYLIWPALIAVLVLWNRRRGGSPRRLLLSALVVITGASFLYSVLHTAESPQTAYFITTTRAWELGVGALLACGERQLRALGTGLSAVLGLVGVGALVTTALVVDTSTAWPGSAALLPVLGAAAVIAAGCGGQAHVAARALGTAPMRWVGGISYPLYLWHWPLLVYASVLWPGLNLAQRCLVGAGAVGLAWVTRRYLEDPIRFNRGLARRNRRVLLGGAGAMGISLLCAALVLATVPRIGDPPPEATGAQVLDRGGDGQPHSGGLEDERTYPRTGTIFPDPALAREDIPSYYEDGCQTAQNSAEIVPDCVYGDPDSQTVVALLGDSKMGQWQTALEEIALAEGWRLELYLKSACAFSATPQQIGEDISQTCTEWNAAVVELLSTPGSVPDLAFVSQGRSTPGPPQLGQAADPQIVEGMADQWRALTEAGTTVVALADNPVPSPRQWPGEVASYECAEVNADDYWVCSFPPNDGFGTAALQAAAEQVEGAHYVDLNPWICPDTECRVVLGGVLTYRQGSHLTAAYIASLTPILHAELDDLGVTEAG